MSLPEYLLAHVSMLHVHVACSSMLGTWARDLLETGVHIAGGQQGTHGWPFSAMLLS